MTAPRCCSCGGGRITSARFMNVYNERTLPFSPATARATSACRPEMPADRHPRAVRGSGEARRHDRGAGVRPPVAGALGALLSCARAWPHQGQLPVRLRRGPRRHDVAHAGGQAVPHRQRHPDHVATTISIWPANLANCRTWASRASACRRTAATWWRWRRSSATRSTARPAPPKPARLDALQLDAPFSNGFYRGARGHGWSRAAN